MFELLTVLATVEGEAKSQSAFYIAGGVLAAWAVLVSFLGMRGIPATDGAARIVMAISALLVAAACASAVITA